MRGIRRVLGCGARGGCWVRVAGVAVWSESDWSWSSGLHFLVSGWFCECSSTSESTQAPPPGHHSPSPAKTPKPSVSPSQSSPASS